MCKVPQGLSEKLTKVTMGHFVCWTLYYSFSVLFFHQIRFLLSFKPLFE